MARHKQVRKCYRCGSEFTWEQTTGSVRQHNLDGSLHYCSKGQTPPSTDVEPMEKALQDAAQVQSDVQANTQAQANESKSAESKSEPVKSEDKKSESKSEPMPKDPAGKTLYELVRPYAVDDFALKSDVEALSSIVGEAFTAVNAKIDKASNINQTITHEVIITKPNEAPKVITGCHRQQAELLEYLALGKNVMLVGPAGTGKTTAADNAAIALETDFYPMSLGPQSSKSDFFGFTDAHGHAVWTVVRKAFTQGGLLLMDEIDASGAGALTYVNSILANGHAAFPSDNGDIKVEVKHPKFLVVAAANTYGHGANAMYTARQRLDAATLDRFIGMDWDYDTDLEKKIGAAHDSYVRYIWALREKSASLGLRAVFGTRKIINGVDLLNAGMSLERVKRAVVFFGLSVDDKMKLGAN